jgi:hypothetical protein
MKKLIVLAASRLFPGRSPMKSTRGFALASLLVFAVAFVLGAPAPASAGAAGSVHAKLYPAADSPSPNASGTATLSGYDNRGFYTVVSVSVSKLEPNASYYMGLVSATGSVGIGIQTDARGKGGNVWSSYGSFFMIGFQARVYDASGTVVLTSNP